MDCPYCKKPMTKGYIYGERYSLKWLEADKKLYAGIYALGGLKLKSNTFWGRQNVKTFKCSECNKLVIDLNDKEVSD